MQLRSNIPDIIERLERLKIAVGAAGAGIPPNPYISDAMLGGVKAAMGTMKHRIFNDGLDADGKSLGKYVGNKSKVTDRKFRVKKYGDPTKNKFRATALKNFADVEGDLTEYEKFRVAQGRQVEYKDLQVTGSLNSSIDTFIDDNGRVVIAIANPEMALISGYQEEQIGKIRGSRPARIFSLSEEEFNLMKKNTNILIWEAVQKVINEQK